MRTLLLLVLPFLGVMAMAQASERTAGNTSASAGIARAAALRCKAGAGVNDCDDAVRWNPSDPSLLAAMGDSLMREHRPGDALRAYRRAATLAPAMAGIGAKIQAAEKSSAKQKSRVAAGDASNLAPQKRFSNSDPDTQTH